MTRGFLKNVLRGGGVCILGGAVFAFSEVFADGSWYNVRLTVPNDPVLEIKVNTDGTGDTAKASLNVAPASLSSAAFNEKNVTISVSTNNDFGYTLVMSVANRNLTSLESNTISNLASKSGGYTCTSETADTCDFTVNSWGYKINSATRTRAATNYLPVPTNVTLNKWTGTDGSNGIANDPTYLSFGSKVNATQTPGAYSTTIIFAATANPDPTPIMQNVSASDLASLMPSDGNTATLKDSRDGNKYNILNINNSYWMVENLRITGTISASESNFTGADFNISAGGDLDLGTTYTEPRTHYDNNPMYGAYYNYCAASAGTICNNTTQQNATSDICPAGWRLPTKDEFSSIEGDGSQTKFSTMAGLYNTNALLDMVDKRGYWWSATYNNIREQYRFVYLGSDGSTVVDYYGDKKFGLSVRCVYDIPTMQSMTSAKLAELMPSNGDTTTLTDKRDGNEYQIMNIGGEYWMNQNLRFIGTVKKDGLSNYSGSDFDITSSGVDFDPNNSSPDAISGQPVATYSGNSDYGAWYNYCAVSAGTSCLSDYTANAISQDICPAGWRIPKSDEFAFDIEILNDYWYPAVGGGVIFVGQQGPDTWFSWVDHAAWWTADADDNNLPLSLYANYGSIYSGYDLSSSAGLYARCIFKTS